MRKMTTWAYNILLSSFFFQLNVSLFCFISSIFWCSLTNWNYWQWASVRVVQIVGAVGSYTFGFILDCFCCLIIMYCIMSCLTLAMSNEGLIILFLFQCNKSNSYRCCSLYFARDESSAYYQTQPDLFVHYVCSFNKGTWML